MKGILKGPEFYAYHTACHLLDAMERLKIIKGRSLGDYSRLYNWMCDNLNLYFE
jgi:hypothetical protein